MQALSVEQLQSKIEDLERRLAESEQLIEAIKAGEVDAFAVNSKTHSEVFTLQSGDYAYRILIEKFSEGALNLTEEGLIVYTNTYFYELLNTPYEKVVGHYIYDFIHPQSLSEFNEIFKQGLKGSGKGEIKLFNRNTIIPVYVSLTSLQPTLETVGMVITDLTEKKKNEHTIAGYQRNLVDINETLSNKNKALELQILSDFSESFSSYKAGIEFFKSLVQDLADKTKLDFIFLGELIEPEQGEFAIKTFALTAFGKPADDIQYALPHGPCEQVIRGTLYSYPDQCKIIFPKNQTLVTFNVEGYIGYPLYDGAGKPIGLIAVMHQQKIRDVNYVQSLLKIAAKRTETELERIRNEKTLELKNQELLKINEELIYSRNFIKNVLESTNHGVLSYRAIRENNVVVDFEIIYANNIALEQIALPAEEVIGNRYLTVYPLAKPHGLWARVTRVLETRNSEIHEVNSPHDQQRWFLVRYVPLEDGVTCTFVEITDQKKNALILQEKNVELERSNSELASFSYIASHDLQEPLRKIKSFSKYILDKENQNLSITGKDYFKRSISAANRMQELIIALLNYSRTNAGEIALQSTDLNAIVEEVKNNLRDTIEENNAVIHSSALPVLMTLPDQFTQLFSNIISNAIKYRKPEVNPVITISADIIDAHQIPDEIPLNNQQYWKVKITDNGIGFEQKYADKIFELFQRLHNRSEYEGTGIGLAICKKIIQNHKGFIKAEGNPGIGSGFNLYLPINTY